MSNSRIIGTVTAAKRAEWILKAKSARASKSVKVARSEGRHKRGEERWAGQDRCLRERGSLRLQEALRQVRLVRDCAYCQRGWQGNAEYCHLKEGCTLLLWITGRGVSESPWIAGGSERVHSTDMPQDGSRQIGYCYAACRNCAGWCCKKKRTSRKKTQGQSREKTLPYCSKQVCCRRMREECEGLWLLDVNV